MVFDRGRKIWTMSAEPRLRLTDVRPEHPRLWTSDRMSGFRWLSLNVVLHCSVSIRGRLQMLTQRFDLIGRNICRRISPGVANIGRNRRYIIVAQLPVVRWRGRRGRP